METCRDRRLQRRIFLERSDPAYSRRGGTCQANILLIGLGSPRQEEVALDFLQVPNLKIVWTVGGLFDFMSRSHQTRTPHRANARFEWLFRIFLEPRRLAIRYLFDALWLAKSCAYEWLIRLKLR